MRGLFITGTDTNVGKTHVACAIVRDLRAAGYRVGAYKPVVSGAVIGEGGIARWDDVEALRDATGLTCSADEISPQRFSAPVAPPVAARLEQRVVDDAELDRGLAAWESKCDIVVIEGAGGLLCPLSDSLTIADWAERIGVPLIVVARTALGTINHTLLTVEVAQRRGLKVAGVILNETEPLESPLHSDREIAARTDVPILALRRHGATDWRSRFGEPVQLDWWPLASEISRG